MKKNEVNIGNNIRNFRELKGFTREQIAYYLNLSVSAYGNIERNQTDLTISRIQQIAEILEVEISQILNFDASQVFNTEHSRHVDDYKDKYIKMLEAENEQLKSALANYNVSELASKEAFLAKLLSKL